MGLLDGTIVTIETTLLPPMVIDLGAELAAPQGLVTQVARPKVTVRNGNVLLYQAMPAGDPAAAPPWGTVIVLGVLVLIAIVVTKGGTT